MVALDPQVLGQILLVDCDDTSLHMATIDNQIVGRPIILRCDVTFNNFDSDLLLNFTWSSNNTIVKKMGASQQSHDHLFIPQLNTSNDGLVYQCEVFNINTDPPLMANSTIVLNLTGRSYPLMLFTYVILCDWILENQANVTCGLFHLIKH